MSFLNLVELFRHIRRLIILLLIVGCEEPEADFDF